MMQLFLEPEDVWLFRDGRPFDAASSHRARSLFPPYPSVLQGAIRSHQLVVQQVDLGDKKAIAKAVGTATDYGSLKMRGPFLAKFEKDTLTRYFPRPADWFPATPDGDKICTLVPGSRPPGILTSVTNEELPLLFYPLEFQPGKKEYGDWLAEKDLIAYLKGEAITPVKSSDLFLRESRVGVKLQAQNRAVEQGMLYEAEFIRPRNSVGLYVEVDGYPSWPASGHLRVGGESHAARFQHTKADALPELPVNPLSHFKVYFASPAYFSEGWKPSNWNKFFKKKVDLQAVAIKGYEVTGGFDYAAGLDKPSLRYVPAGSVYYFKSEEKVTMTELLIQEAITEMGVEIGFGQVIITEWNTKKE